MLELAEWDEESRQGALGVRSAGRCLLTAGLFAACVLSAYAGEAAGAARAEVVPAEGPAPPRAQASRGATQQGDPERARTSSEDESDEPAPTGERGQQANRPTGQQANKHAGQHDDLAPTGEKAKAAHVPVRKTGAGPGDPELARTPQDEEDEDFTESRCGTGCQPVHVKQANRLLHSHVRPGDPEQTRDAPKEEDAGPALTVGKAEGPRVPARKTTIRPGDPELARDSQKKEGDEPALAEERAGAVRVPSRERVIHPGDPESAPVCPLDEESGGGTTPDLAGPPPKRAVPAVLADVPRFLSGEGLDGEAAEIVGAVPSGPGPKTREEKPPALAPLLQGDRETDPRAVERDAGGAKAPPGEKPAGPEDQQKQLAELIAQVKKNNETLRALGEETRDKTVHGPGGEDSGLRVRDPRAARIMEAILRDTPLGTISGIITDGTGKQPVPARVRLTDITETSLQAPLAEGFWCPGRFSTPVVSGPVRVEVTRGRFYPTLFQGLQVKPHETKTVELSMGRPAALNFVAQGWYLADLDLGLRAQRGERPVWLGNAPEVDNLVLAAQAEGVQVLGVPVPWGESNSEAAVEALADASNEVLLLPVFPGPRHAFYGCGMGLGMKSWAGLPREVADPQVPLREAFEEVHARGGLVVYKDLNGGKKVDIRHDIFSLFPGLERTGFYPQDSSVARLYAANELPYDTVTGPAYDALALDGSAAAERLWFNLLNQGYTISVIGSGGGSLEGGRLPYGQTFISVAGPLSRGKVLEAIRQGCTAVSFGPAVFCRILERDKGPGSVLPADGRRLTLQIQAYSGMSPGLQLGKVEIIRNGEVVHEQAASEGESQIENLCWTVGETVSAWYVIRVTERCNTPASGCKPGRAWTNAIYFRGAGFAPLAPATSRVTGTLRRGLTPVAGTVTAVVPGQAAHQVAADKNGSFRIELPASGSLVFEAPGCEPLGQRVFAHPRVMRALGALQAERDGLLREELAGASLFPAWRLLLTDLEWDVALLPSAEKLLEEPKAEPGNKRD